LGKITIYYLEEKRDWHFLGVFKELINVKKLLHREKINGLFKIMYGMSLLDGKSSSYRVRCWGIEVVLKRAFSILNA